MTDQTRDDGALSAAEGFDRTPWEPPGLRFEVGQRVRIRLSAECSWRGDGVHAVTGVLVTRANPHWPALDGRIAVVDEADPIDCPDGHWVHVTLEDPPLVSGVGRLVGTAMCPAELQPIHGEAR